MGVRLYLYRSSGSFIQGDTAEYQTSLPPSAIATLSLCMELLCGWGLFFKW